MKRLIVPRYFIFSVLLLLILASLYVFSEAQRLQRELLRQTEAKAIALAEAMATNVKNVVLGNSLLEDLISQRLLDNARLIDQLLLSRRVDRTLLAEIAAMNRLQKIELLDLRGRPMQPPFSLPAQPEMEEMMARVRRIAPAEGLAGQETVILVVWGRRWWVPVDAELPVARPARQLAEREFWEGSVFGVAIQARSFPGIIALHANADYILNLALNGIQAMPEGGKLALGARAHGDELVLTVADSGSGIPPELLPRIFEPYFTTKANGSGLGLAIARRIAEAHGGTLTGESRPGQGSRFHVTLPLRKASV